MIVLSCKDISKSYGVNSIFENISFNVEDKDKIGLIGKNGSGKTSLLKILSKEIPYDSGEIYISQNKKIGVLTQHINIDSNETLYDECLKVFQHLIDKEGRIRELETEMTKFSESESELSRIMEEYSSLCEEFEREEGYGYKSFPRIGIPGGPQAGQLRPKLPRRLLGGCVPLGPQGRRRRICQ